MAAIEEEEAANVNDEDGRSANECDDQPRCWNIGIVSAPPLACPLLVDPDIAVVIELQQTSSVESRTCDGAPNVGDRGNR
jgi:hypothetical protein